MRSQLGPWPSPERGVVGSWEICFCCCCGVCACIFLSVGTQGAWIGAVAGADAAAAALAFRSAPSRAREGPLVWAREAGGAPIWLSQAPKVCSALARPYGAQRSFSPRSRYFTGLPHESRAPKEAGSHVSPLEAPDRFGRSSAAPTGTFGVASKGMRHIGHCSAAGGGLSKSYESFASCCCSATLRANVSKQPAQKRWPQGSARRSVNISKHISRAIWRLAAANR